MIHPTDEQERKEHEEYNRLMDECHAEDVAQEKRDANTLVNVRRIAGTETFKHIENALAESEHHLSYKIVEAPVGDPQDEDGDTVWVSQTCGPCGDDYSGTCCMALPDGTYFMWDYWM